MYRFFIVVIEEGQKVGSGQWFEVKDDEDVEVIKAKLKEAGWTEDAESVSD